MNIIEGLKKFFVSTDATVDRNGKLWVGYYGKWRLLSTIENNNFWDWYQLVGGI
jgi:hypothetical protein